MISIKLYIVTKNCYAKFNAYSVASHCDFPKQAASNSRIPEPELQNFYGFNSQSRP